MLATRTARLIAGSVGALRLPGPGIQDRVRLVPREFDAALERQAPVDDHAVAPAAAVARDARAIDRSRLDRQQADELEVATKLVGCAVADPGLGARDRVAGGALAGLYDRTVHESHGEQDRRHGEHHDGAAVVARDHR